MFVVSQWFKATSQSAHSRCHYISKRSTIRRRSGQSCLSVPYRSDAQDPPPELRDATSCEGLLKTGATFEMSSSLLEEGTGAHRIQESNPVRVVTTRSICRQCLSDNFQGRFYT